MALLAVLFCAVAMLSCRDEGRQGYLRITPEGRQEVGAKDTRVIFRVESNLDWSVSISENSGSNNQFTADRSEGRGNGSVEVTFGENRSQQPRHATVTFTATDKAASGRLHKNVIEIEQAAAGESPAEYLEIELPESDFAADALSARLIIETDSQWTIRTHHLSPVFSSPWQITSSKATGTGEAEVLLQFDVNYEYDRTAEIIVSTDNITEKVMLTQRGRLGGTDFPAWTELPEIALDANTLFYTHHTALAGGESVRNYSLLYDKSTYTSYWVAYPLHGSYMGTGRTDKWGYDPRIPRLWQVNYSSAWGTHNYDRGHQIASADRNATGERGNPSDMNVQTFHYTNITPQRWQLNQQKWESLEGFLRGKVSGNADTMWVVTGALLRSAGGSETINYLPKTNGAGEDIEVPVPNYYFKVALWHRTVGNAKQYTAVGFWMDNADTPGQVARSDARTVRDIEALTGFDFFFNIPPSEQDLFETVVGEGWF